MKFILLVILLNGDYYGGQFDNEKQCRKEIHKLEIKAVVSLCETDQAFTKLTAKKKESSIIRL